MPSIRFWLAGALGLTLVLLLAVLGVVSHLMLRQAVEDHMRLRLDQDLENLAALLRVRQDGRLYVPPNRLDPAFQRPGSGRYFQIVSDQRGELRSSSLENHRLPIPEWNGRRLLTERAVGPEGFPILLHARQFDPQGERILFMVAEDYTPVLMASRRWQLAFLLVTGFGILVALLIQHRILQRGFAPMQKIRQELEDLGEGRLQQLSHHAPAEISPLVHALNRLLRVMDERLVRSRRAAGDLAHALKTPLSAFQIMLESPEAAALPNRTALQERLNEMRARMNRELRRAQLMGGKTPGARFKPEEDLPDLVKTLLQIYRHKTLEIRPHYRLQKPISADREDMLELFGNLLDNACKWATHEVQLEVESDPTGWHLCVSDDGPGVASSQLPMLVQRGRRFDEQTAGNGLGLSIVQDIVEVYQGELSLDHDPKLGGLRAKIVFPS